MGGRIYFSVVALLAMAPTSAISAELRLQTANARIPVACLENSTYPIMAAVHDDPVEGDGSGEAVYLFCNEVIFKHFLVADTIAQTATWFHGFVYATAVGIGGGQVLSFQATSYGVPPSLYEHHVRDLTDTSFLGNFNRDVYYGVTMWDHQDSVYVLGGSIDGNGDSATSMDRFSITEHGAERVGELPKPLRMASGVWVPQQERALLFGGIDGATNEIYTDILAYDPTTQSVTTFGHLPVPTYHSCAVWTGQVAYVLCGNDQHPEHNMVIVDPFANDGAGGVTTAEVQGFDFGCSQAVCAYSERLNRVYIFGGTRDGNWTSHEIMYIDLDGVPTEPTPPPESTPMPEPTPTQEGTTIVTEAPSTPVVTATPEPPPKGCSAQDKYGVLYEAPLGGIARNPCPRTSRGQATWVCTANGTFEGPRPNYSNCTSLWLEEVKDLIADGTPINATAASALLLHIRENVEDARDPAKNLTYFGHEIQTIFQVGENVLELVEAGTSLRNMTLLTEDAFTIFDRVLVYMDPWEELSLEARLTAGSVFLESSDGATLGLAQRSQFDEDQPKRYRQAFHSSKEFTILSGSEPVPSSGRSQGPAITFPENPNTKSDSYIEIPRDWPQYFVGQDHAAIAGLRLEQEYTSFLFPAPVATDAVKILNGPLLSFTFGTNASARVQAMSTRLNFTDSGVQITFQHEVSAWGPERPKIRRRLHPGEQPKAVLGSGVCTYWDPASLTWSRDGCRLVSTERGTTVCECDHLTAFAVIMDLHDYVGKTLLLEIMTLVLCPLSILCLGLTIAVFLYSRFKRQLLSKHPRNDLTLNLCISLLVANVLILVTMDKHYLHLSDEVCTASAIALHYVLLLAFAWMALEGMLLAKLVFVDVFSTGREHATLERIGAYLIPAVIVGATCGLNFGRGDHGYGNDAYCWLHGKYLWSFIAVAAAVLTFNLTVLIAALRKSSSINSHPNSNFKVIRHSKASSVWIRGAMSLTIIMGLTWISGFLMLVDNEVTAHIAAYIFTGSSASQGVFIFLFHVIASPQLRKRFKALRFLHSTTNTSGTRDGVGRRSQGVATKANGVSRSTRTTATSRRGTFATLYS